jgi:quercetin dioxygenase-like cupin family protein
MNTHTQITPGQTLENPVTGERFTFVHTAATTGGELLAFDFALRPGGAVPLPHVHPVQTERFEVVEGLMRFRLGLRTRLAGPGEVVEVAPGVVHSFANAGEQEARLRVEVRPALEMEAAWTYDRVAHAPLLGLRGQRLLLAPVVFSARHPRAGLAAAAAATLGLGGLG